MTIFHGPDNLAYMMTPELANDFARGSRAFERELIVWAEQFLPQHSTFVDVGAHVGTWTFPFARKAERVVAIEAQRQNFYRLAAGIAMNELWNIDAHHAAATDSMAPAIVHVGVHDWSGFGGSLEEFPINGETRPESVRGLTIDSLRIANVGLVKIDVEGHELEVIDGMLGTLAQSWPTLVVEVWSDEIFPWYATKRRATLERLGALGYSVTPITGWPHMVLCAHAR